MDFQPGDWVVHCTQGLGQVKNVENRSFGEKSVLYYMVQIADLTIWVPADENLGTRLRKPVNQAGFQSLITTLTSPPEELPTDRRQRSQYLLDVLKDGSADSLCRVIRDLSAHRKHRTWSENDSELNRRIKKTFIREWSFIFSIQPLDAEAELQKLLSQNT
ncbi:MAG: CarD family transcriptional regulator [Anaerolineales bacterium]|jgi:RNA polymerase-interacting CarD/CdnL/TRCF family regulator|nr:CarD family transcriptional regulator [Anaerolineales bacterium]